MLQYHGWLVIEAAPYETETEDADRRAAVGFVQDLVDAAAADGVQGLRDLRWVNGQAQFHFGGFRNHRNAEFDGLLASIAELGRRAPGTYGVVHYADDEDPVHHNDFRLVVIRRGEMVERTDPNLSPVVPLLEDAYVVGEEP